MKLAQKTERLLPGPAAVPPFEELALTTPGGLAENVALLQVDGDGELKILTAGQAFEAWIGRPARGLKVAELSIDRRAPCRGCTTKPWGMHGRCKWSSTES
jgi:hypothetical protein